MSSSAPAEASVPKEEKEKKGFGRVLSRVKTVLKREGSSPFSSKRQSTIATPSTAPTTTTKPTTTTATTTTTTARPPATATATATATETETETPKKSEPTPWSKAAEAMAKYEKMEGVFKLTRSQILEERAMKLGERYGLNIKASEWQSGNPDDTVLRMDKPIRMRVRRTCHRCDATFTSARECPNCHHARCTNCTRYPPRRTEAEIIASRERRAAIIKANKENAPIIPDYTYAFDEKKIILTRPSKTGGQDLVHKKPRQRLRRTCHECSTLFISGNKTCEKCGHNRCTDCPRDPPKKEKYPYGYPGDEFGPSSVPHYECKMCRTIYPTGAEDGTACSKCGLLKTDDSPRVLPRKVEPEHDPELLSQLQARLENLRLKVT